MAGEADAGLSGRWTKDGYGLVKSLPNVGKPKVIHRSSMRLPKGELAKTPAQNLTVHKAHLAKLFICATPDSIAALIGLDPLPVLIQLGEPPSPTEVFTASRRLSYSSGGSWLSTGRAAESSVQA